ncbi:MAG TPA: FtsX-like permease family protein, partial [Solirubrobacterales bacterium]|nr:FtsX-like permease family protein [Solirubrobacterales bacterium]
MSRAGIWLRWSWRDLKRRWVLIVAIALVLAIGTGIYSGLGSLENWRKESNDASFAALNAHDLEVSLAEGARAPAGELRRVVESLPGSDQVAAVSERLIVPTQIEIARPGEEPLVTGGELVGSELGPGGPPIDGVAADAGRGLRGDDAGRPVAVLEASFGSFHDLPSTGTLRVAGGKELRYVGQGRSPEYFLVTRPAGGEFGGAEASFAVLFSSLATVQRLAGGTPGVNDAVLTLRPGADQDIVRRQLESALDQAVPGTDVTTLADEPAHRILYKDAEGDQRLFEIFAYLILAGAAFAAFNLASRIVEAQRREIGVGMALGVPPKELAVRPLLLGAEIAVAGTGFGLALGLLAGEVFRGTLEDLLPLPEMRTPFELHVFVRGALAGLLLPLVATAIPVWRGVRVPPIEAIRVGFRSARSSGLAAVGKRVHLPGSALVQMPVRNVLRAPRRTLLTALGVGTIVAVVTAFSGLVDSFLGTVDRSERETSGATPSRIVVTLDGFHGDRSGPVRSIERTPGVGAVEGRLQVPGSLGSGDDRFDALIGLQDSSNRLWQPTVVSGSGLRPGEDGILISEEAAGDLGVGVGDEVAVTYPRRIGPRTFGEAEARIRVVGLHPDPFRIFAYMDESQAGRMGLAGEVNQMDVAPEAGSSEQEIKRNLFGVPIVAGVERATASTEFVRKRMDDFLGIIRVTELFALLLALLIAFNSTSISVDERSRENATMIAFGVRSREAVGLSIVESAIIGLLGTIAGIAIGVAILNYILDVTLPDTLPDLGVPTSLGLGTVAKAFGLGVVAV